MPSAWRMAGADPVSARGNDCVASGDGVVTSPHIGWAEAHSSSPSTVSQNFMVNGKDRGWLLAPITDNPGRMRR
jgi:hypothetical protein